MTDDFNVNFCKVLVRKTSDVDRQEQYEEPLIDVIDEDNSVKLLVQGRCMDQQFSIHVNEDKSGISICREACYIEKGAETVECADYCSKNIPLNLNELQLEGMLFVVSKCNNNNVLEIVIPKRKQEQKKTQSDPEKL
jgi:HSP20 family molecular chaperone IbpA